MIMGEGKEEDKQPKKRKREIDENDKTLHGLALHPGNNFIYFRILSALPSLCHVT